MSSPVISKARVSVLYPIHFLFQAYAIPSSTQAPSSGTLPSSKNNNISHGIIDLLIDCGDYLMIVDYKLKNIDDINYDKQLNGYRTFLENKTGRRVECYLYSIIDSTYRMVKW